MVVLVEVRAQRGRQEALLAEVLTASRIWTAESGNLGVTVLRDPDEPTRLVIIEAFASDLALQGHEELPATAAFAGRVQPLLAGPPARSTWLVAARTSA